MSESASEAGQEEPPVFPEDYTGIRDPMMAHLYKTWIGSLEYQSKKLEEPDLSPLERARASYFFSLHAAYVKLIQEQRHYYLGDGKNPPMKRPANTDQVRYHVSGMGDMQTIMELHRSEFPEIFESREEMERLEREAIEQLTKRHK